MKWRKFLCSFKRNRNQLKNKRKNKKESLNKLLRTQSLMRISMK